ncbi:TetR/AcrR family transcriptional regulator C-terminal domain-containing protein [Paenibacillus flagellatus]|uniref:TetR family transcriptional regulator n=1 Tax=Paenibacillus flagellatus TaxID=2211139 RepID=A0A2V5JZ99_9BACL|nr:TetR/AcrR family transcriptional regulator C-terminal domain-containing protein [Paenibacillus flagellatus]PYI52061.1 TetR family transcriptional regulator [Paenibacillus flagellatus]
MARRRIHRPSEERDEGREEPLHTPLDRSRIVNAALAVLQAEGLERISMRNIAEHLGVKAAALYYHVKDKEQLLHLLAEKIGSETELPGEELPWRERLSQWAFGFRGTLHRYRDAAAIMGATIAAGPSRLDHIEFLFRTLSEAGFRDEHVPWLAAMLKNYVTGFADEEARLADRARREETNADGLADAYAGKFRALAPDRYPHMIRLASRTTAVEWEREFRFGLDVLLDGFEAKRPVRSD